MNLRNLDIPHSRLYPIVVLDRILSHRMRHMMHNAIDTILGILIIAAALLFAARFVPLLPPEHLAAARAWAPRIFGLILILLAVLLVVYLLEVFFRFLYFREGIVAWRTHGRSHETDLLSFGVLKILYDAADGDVTGSFLRSNEGVRIITRAGIDKDAWKTFMRERKAETLDAELPITPGKIFTFRSLVGFLIHNDEEFRNFLFSNGVRDSDAVGAAEWVMREMEDEKISEQWWSRSRLAAIPGVGKDWAYGEISALLRYGHEVLEEYSEHASVLSAKDEREVHELERVLSRAQEANALLVGEKGAGTMDIVHDFAQKIREGSITPELEHKKVFLINGDSIIASMRGKEEFEREFITILNEAIRAGNLILVFPDFPSFVASAHNIGSNVVSLMDPYFTSPKIQFIAVSDNEMFHERLEQDGAFMTRFEKVAVTEPSEAEMIVILQRVAENLEKNHSIFFTYSAIEEALQAAQNYLPDGVLPDKAIDLLIEAVPRAMEQGEYLITRSDILALITLKTKIPVGELSDGERVKLMNLEKFLHMRVVGQNEAVSLISNAMRRARVGVRNMKRPIGSFLFLGPTGVGKTETAKALAEAFFSNEDAISRFDMSEYQTDDALARLIGNFEGEKVGTLTKVLKEKPFGVLLLDEFEKTNHDVLDLFLQILDEGFFSDMRGKRVNARNVIIIATSNAGSDLIWEAVQQGKDLLVMKDEIINKIILRGIFKPELINRFDGVVLFHPLDVSHLSQIARLMLEKLKTRLHARGIDLLVTDDLVNTVIRYGMDSSFGARPMNRAIQEYVEQVIADKLIRGEIKEGSQVSITPEDFRTPPVPKPVSSR
jgi:ATP-dependent Clp protease ATP-binding subunit ClpC